MPHLLFPLPLGEGAKDHVACYPTQLGRDQRRLDPASTVIMAPVIPRALVLEARNTYAPARSLGCRAICRGLLTRMRSAIPGSAKWDCSPRPMACKPRKSVLTPPGATPFTRTCGANSAANCRIIPTTACFEAVYSTPPPPELKPATEAVKIIQPSVARSAGNAALA